MMPDAQVRYDLLRGAFEELQGVSRWDATLKVAANFCEKLGLDSAVDLIQTAVLPADDGQAAFFLIGDTGYSFVLKSPPPLDEEQEILLRMFSGWLASCPLFQKGRIVLTSYDESEIEARVQKLVNPLRQIRPLNETLDLIIQSLASHFKTDIAFVALFSPVEQLVRFERFYRTGQLVPTEPVSVLNENSLTSWVIMNNHPYFSENWEEEGGPAPGLFMGLDAQGIIIVPLVYEQQVLGAISVQQEKAGGYDLHDFATMTQLSAEFALILHNAGVFQETKLLVEKSTTDYLTAVALRQAIAIVGTSLDKERVLNNMLMAIAGVMSYDVALAYVVEEESLQLVAGHDFYERPIPILFNDANVEWEKFPLFQTVVQQRTPLIIDNVQDDVRWVAFDGSEQVKVWMGIPLMVGNRVLGVLGVIRQEGASFDKREVWLATTLASHGSIALQNAISQYQTQSQLEELSTLYQATATMTANLDQDFVLQSVAAEMLRALRVDTCTIFVWDSISNTLLPVAHKNQVYPEERPLNSDDPSQMVGLSKIENLATYEVVQRIFKRQEAYTVRRDNAISPEQQQLLESSGLQSVLLLPLVQRNDVLGLLALGQVYSLRTIEQRRLSLAQNLAGQAAVAIDHARLFSQAKRRVSELSTFHSIILHLNTPLNLNAVLDTIMDSALKLVDASNLHIYLYNTKTDSFTLGAALWRDGGREPAVSAPRKNGITHEVVRTGRQIVVNRAAEHPLWQSEDAKAWGIHAIAGFPIKQGSEVIGAFTATYKSAHTFTEDELLLLNLLSDHAAVAVKNARLFEESERRFREMSALVELAKQVTSSLSLQEVLQTTVDTLRKLLNARASTITMLDDDKSELILMAGSGVDQEYIRTVRLQLGEGVSGTVVRRGEPVYIADTHKESNFLAFSDQVRSLLVVPLTNREEIIGTMTIDSDRPDAFADSSIQLMTIAALQVSVAIANARMFEELQKGAAELSLAYEELKENDRMKEELVQNLSHELRTPLTFVKGYVDLLMEGEMGALSEEQQNILSIVTMKTDEITRLIDDIVTLQRIDSANLEKSLVDLRGLIDETIVSCQLMAEERGLQVDFLAPDYLEGISLDRGRIIQVLNNLLVNAIKFSPNGGRITIDLIDHGYEVEIRIADEGIGLPQDKVGRIFDRFYQVDGSVRRKFGGTGLGLAIVKRIIDAHGGRVWAESRLNSGSMFTFVLPRIEIYATNGHTV